MNEDYDKVENRWIAHDKDSFNYFTNNNPPRNGVFLKQFLADLKGLNTLALLISGIVCISISIVYESISIFAFGVAISLIYLMLLLKVTLADRVAQLKTGHINKLEDHEFYSHMSTALAKTNENEDIPVVFETEPAKTLVGENGTAMVIFLYSPKEQYSTVLGIKTG